MTERTERLQVEISLDDIKAIDDFQFDGRFPTWAAAIRELLRRGLAEASKDNPRSPH